MPCDAEPALYKAREGAAGKIITGNGTVLSADIGGLAAFEPDGVGHVRRRNNFGEREPEGGVRMDRKMECPICKKKAVFVGVHDDEGNYHGLMGCEYENAPWSGLSYALHHEGWGDCPLCTDGAESTMGGMLFDTAEEAISALSPPNEPLTIEQLREMDGEPVWIVEQPDWGHWELSADAEDYLANRDQDFYGLKHDDPAGRYGLHVLGWLAYRRPPEGEEERHGD
jgi:hypothetical protein